MSNTANIYAESIRSAISDLNNKSIYRVTKTTRKGSNRFEWYKYLGFQITSIRALLLANDEYFLGAVRVLPLKQTVHLWLGGGLLGFNEKGLNGELLTMQRRINQILNTFLDTVYFSGDAPLCALTCKYSSDVFKDVMSFAGVTESKADDAILQLQIIAQKALDFIEPRLERSYRELPNAFVYATVKRDIEKYARSVRINRRIAARQAGRTNNAGILK